MRLNINLASQKYEDVRRFFRRWTLALSALSVLALALALLAWRNHSNASDLTGQIKKERAARADLQSRRANAERIEHLPENVDVTLQKTFWNNQLVRRSFSWTQMLNDLQKIMPRRAYVASVHPELEPDNRLKLKLAIVGEKKSDAIDLVHKMENSDRFRKAMITDESQVKGEGRPGTLPVTKFGIEADYNPAGIMRKMASQKEGF